MFILNNYKDEITKLPKLTDSEYMTLQISELTNLFHNQIAAIKNNQHEFVAFTNQFAKEFNADNNLLGKAASHLPNMSHNNYTEIYKQEEIIINNHEFQDSMYLLKKDNKVINYVIRKTPLVNPTTNNCVGILINTRRFVPDLFRRVMLSKFVSLPKYKKTLATPEMSEQQQQVAFCLLLGFHSRKEIVTILSTLSKSEYNETMIKNSLQALYNKFECHTPGQLLDLISIGQIPVELPASIVLTGNYPFNVEAIDTSNRNHI